MSTEAALSLETILHHFRSQLAMTEVSLDRWRNDSAVPKTQIKSAQHHVTALASAIILLESTGKDSKMLDWLEEQGWVEFSSVGGKFVDASSLSNDFAGDSYREAITAAMQKEEAK